MKYRVILLILFLGLIYFGTKKIEFFSNPDCKCALNANTKIKIDQRGGNNLLTCSCNNNKCPNDIYLRGNCLFEEQEPLNLLDNLRKKNPIRYNNSIARIGPLPKCSRCVNHNLQLKENQAWYSQDQNFYDF